MLREQFKLHKRFRGIAFSVPYRPWKPGDDTAAPLPRPTNAPYLCLLTVVERGLGDECMAIAREAGAQGGTIIHAHGAGVPQDFYFPLVIEPQKGWRRAHPQSHFQPDEPGPDGQGHHLRAAGAQHRRPL